MGLVSFVFSEFLPEVQELQAIFIGAFLNKK